jgi:hypothetical protein
MHILLFPDRTVNSAPLAEELRQHIGRRSVAAWRTQLRKPVKEMIHAMNTVASRFGIEYPNDGVIADQLYDHARMEDRAIWHRAAKNDIDRTCQVWKERHMMHLTIIDDCFSLDEIEVFKPGFSVALQNATTDSPIYKPPGGTGLPADHGVNFHATIQVGHQSIDQLCDQIHGLYHKKIGESFV